MSYGGTATDQVIRNKHAKEKNTLLKGKEYFRDNRNIMFTWFREGGG